MFWVVSSRKHVDVFVILLEYHPPQLPNFKWKIPQNCICSLLLSVPLHGFCLCLYMGLGVDIQIYIPGTQMTSIFEGQPLKTRPFRTKRRVIWVPGIYIVRNIYDMLY